MANCLRKRDQNVYSIFSKSCPLGHQGFLFKWFQGENECLLEFPTMTTNSFRIPIVQKFENIFAHIFLFSFALGLIFFLEASIKFMKTKSVQTKSIHQSKVYIFQKVHSQVKTFITRTAPS